MESVTIGVSGKTCNISLLKLNKKKKKEKSWEKAVPGNVMDQSCMGFACLETGPI